MPSPDQPTIASPNLDALITTLESAARPAPEMATRALRQVLDGVITGEGPTTRGRVHFSRCLDGIDAALCTRILIAAGGKGDLPVSRAEAELLLDIDAAATERCDNGAFDALLAKAVAHCVQAAAGRPVPPRHVALSPETPLSSWAVPLADEADDEILTWIATEAKSRRRPNATLMAIVAFLAGAAASPIAQSIVGVFDLSA
jgi:hypothetical protein